MGTFDSDAWAVKAEPLLCSSFFDTAEEDVMDVRVSPLSFFFPPLFFSLSFFFCPSVFDTAEEDVSDVRVSQLSFFSFLIKKILS
jgi:hypothetical protein